jgi:hypothetical protein
VQLELEAGDHAEVPAAALQRPEQVRIPIGVRHQQAAVRSHHLGRDQAVDGEAVLPLEPAAAAAEGQPADARVREPPAGHREPEGLCLAIELTPVGAASAPGGASLRVHADPVHPPEVDHQAAVHDGVAGDGMAAASDG